MAKFMFYKIESMEMEEGKLPLLMMEKDNHLPFFYRHFIECDIL